MLICSEKSLPMLPQMLANVSFHAVAIRLHEPYLAPSTDV